MQPAAQRYVPVSTTDSAMAGVIAYDRCTWCTPSESSIHLAARYNKTTHKADAKTHPPIARLDAAAGRLPCSVLWPAPTAVSGVYD
jgi:hypothetical protein